jgi:hypothetical protein
VYLHHPVGLAATARAESAADADHTSERADCAETNMKSTGRGRSER